MEKDSPRTNTSEVVTKTPLIKTSEAGTHSKFIVVTGGVISGLGKGIVTASIGSLLQAQGFNVTNVKIDPYINIDAGTMRPTEHGEVFVTADGGETDQDIGTYERFLGRDLSKENNITTGQVYLSVIQKERNLEYDGRCVEVIPHIPLEVERRVRDIGGKSGADFVVVEVGGTIGDYQNVLFLEAFRAMHLRGEKVRFVHVVYLPVPGNIGEMKTKPAQHSVRMLLQTGIQPDFIVARSSAFMDEVRKEKLSVFCNVRKENVISSPDVKNIYEIPMVFEGQSFTTKLLGSFGLAYKSGRMKEWEKFLARISGLKKVIRVGIVGKYFDTGDFTLEDSYISVIEALKHASWANGARPEIQWIDSKDFERGTSFTSDTHIRGGADKKLETLSGYDGIIVPGGFGSSGVEGKIQAIRFCREKRLPYLGLCYGMQLAVVEFARNVCRLKDANSSELSACSSPVIDILPEQKVNLQQKNYGATMRLGEYTAKLKKGSLVMKLYGKESVEERHRHRYEVNPEFIEELEAKGMVFSGASADRRLMEYMELPSHPFFVGTQAHPEFTSKPFSPNPLFLGFAKACIDRVKG